MKLWARIAYVLLVLLAAPAMLWTSFEAYGLTLSGPQMLFYSVLHAQPALAIAVFFSIPIFLLWAAVNGALLAAVRLREAAGIAPRELKVYLQFQAAHIVALVFYEAWSAIAVVRVSLCIVGIWLLWRVLETALVGSILRMPAKQEQRLGRR